MIHLIGVPENIKLNNSDNQYCFMFNLNEKKELEQVYIATQFDKDDMSKSRIVYEHKVVELTRRIKGKISEYVITNKEYPDDGLEITIVDFDGYVAEARTGLHAYSSSGLLVILEPMLIYPFMRMITRSKQWTDSLKTTEVSKNG